MGRMLKNTVFKTGSYTLGVPNATSNIRPIVGSVGQTYYDTYYNKLYYYNGSDWKPVTHEGNVTIVKDSFTGDNTNSVFGPMSYSYNAGQEAQVIAVVNNVVQNPGVGFEFMNNTSIKFTSVPTTSAPIYILHNFASTVAS